MSRIDLPSGQQWVSVLIFTKNEELDLPGCLESVQWCDDVHICDSGSVDRTLEIAELAGAKVVRRTYVDPRPFGGDESAHKNWAFRSIKFAHPWVFMLDADERVTPELAREVQRVAASEQKSGSASAYRVLRRDYLFDTWLKHVTPSPFNIRLVRLGAVRFERLTNPVTVIDGAVADIPMHFDHYPFSKGFRHWFDKHNQYSTSEAEQNVLAVTQRHRFSLRQAFLSRDRSTRRVHQKGIYYRLPFRPLVMFTALYIFKRGFMDGRAGFTFAMLRAIYEYMIVLKVRELRGARSNQF